MSHPSINAVHITRKHSISLHTPPSTLNPHTHTNQGKPWQFKDFPFKGAAKGDMVDTFSNVFGAFFHYKDEAVSCCLLWLVGSCLCCESFPQEQRVVMITC